MTLQKIFRARYSDGTDPRIEDDQFSIRRKNWRPGYAILVSKGRFHRWISPNASGPRQMSVRDVMADDWEVI